MKKMKLRKMRIIVYVENRAKDVVSVIIIQKSWYNFQLYRVNSFNLGSVDLTGFEFTRSQVKF